MVVSSGGVCLFCSDTQKRNCITAPDPCQSRFVSRTPIKINVIQAFLWKNYLKMRSPYINFNEFYITILKNPVVPCLSKVLGSYILTISAPVGSPLPLRPRPTQRLFLHLRNSSIPYRPPMSIMGFFSHAGALQLLTYNIYAYSFI